jgi:glucose/arabinose dehydrogenase/mono/diheme cytochrome c family protein
MSRSLMPFFSPGVAVLSCAFLSQKMKPACVFCRVWIVLFVSVISIHAQPPPESGRLQAPARGPVSDAYNSWMLAKSGLVPGPDRLQLAPGFTAELIRVAAPEEDSWVGMTFDGKGRIIVAREKRGLLRFTLDGARVGKVEVVNDELLECRGLLWAHDSLYVNANNSKGLYRLRDTHGDDHFDESRLLLHTEGGVGHGRNHLHLGADGFIYIAHGDDPVPADDQLSAETPYRNWAVDRLTPAQRTGGKPPTARTGHVLRIDADAKKVERLCGGLRNPLGVAANRDGELFVYDADMEWDVGLPWYRPTRVLHIVPGGEYGWRHELSFPLGAEDNLPAVCDIGLGSPTGVTFGYGARFPAKYCEAFFIADWAYGRIIAVHLRPVGASYRGEMETFVAGRPLNVTDVTIGPDGAMYFITGGRRTQSALYRVCYTGGESTDALAPHDSPQNVTVRALRRDLEKLQSGPAAGGTRKAIENIAHPDRWIRFAARVALEAQPVGEWRSAALDGKAPCAWLALARAGSDEDRIALLRRLAATPIGSLEPDDRLQFARAIEVCLARLAVAGRAIDAEVKEALSRSLASAPLHGSAGIYREVCLLLVWIGDDAVLGKMAALLKSDLPSEDAAFYLSMLASLRTGWDPSTRKSCFEALRRAEAFAGARQYVDLLKRVRADLVAGLTDDERRKLGDLVEAKAPIVPLPTLAPAKFVRAWEPQDFAADLRQPLHDRNLAAGKAAYSQAGCAVCHRIAGNDATQASVVGPDLTGVGARFGPDALLLHIIEPSLVIDDKYRNPDAPNISPMPAGLLNSLERDQVLDLLAYLAGSGGAKAGPEGK